MELRFQVHGKIRKPVAEVFDAVVNPKKLSGYFTTGGSSGALVAGSTVSWDFADFPGAFPVHVREVVPERLQEACTPEALAEALLLPLQDPAAAAAQRAGFAEALAHLRAPEGLPSEAAAEAVLRMLPAR